MATVEGTDNSETIDLDDGVTQLDDTIRGFGGHDDIFGFDGNDRIFGGTGDDFIDGGDGNDSIEGGPGADDIFGGSSESGDFARYDASAAGVTVSLINGAGLGGDAQGDTLTGIENLNGSSHNDLLIGNDTDNNLGGSGGNDTLKGGGGDDALFGQTGNDILRGGSGADTLNGVLGAGIDSDTADYTGSSAGVGISLNTGTTNGGDAEGDELIGIENLTGSAFSDTLTGDGGVNVLEGAAGSDTLTGGGGNDLLQGGSSGDFMNGGLGVDRATYADSSAGVSISLFADTASGGYAAGDMLLSIENLTGSNFSDTLIGDDGINALVGNGGNDVLKGFGGSDTLRGYAGNDSLIGGDGNDNMIGDGGNDVYTITAGDTVTEGVGQGTDRVNSLFTHTLAANVENLTLTGASAINGVGNALNNAIFGNNANNILNGGAGIDVLDGNGGNDAMSVDNLADVVLEAVGEGTDNVNASVSYTLAPGVSAETLRTANAAAVTAINLTGNEINNFVTGNAGNNQINGRAGDDTLTGNAGNDTFFFNTTLNVATNVDTVVDFSVANDTFRLENAVFAGLAAGALAADAFHIGAAAGDAEDRIIYNSGTGALSFDSNGNAAGGLTMFAQLSAGLGLTSADFVVV